MSFRRIRLADFDAAPVKRANLKSPSTQAQAINATGNVLSTEPLQATLLPPRPTILTKLQTGQERLDRRCAIDANTGLAMIDGPGGVRLWPIRGSDVSVTPLLFKSDEPTIPLFITPQNGSNQPEVILVNTTTGNLLHIRRISFALTDTPASATIALKGETIVQAIAVGYSVVCATSTGKLWLVQLNNGFGGVAKPTIYPMSRSWFGWAQAPVVDMASHNGKLLVLRHSGACSLYDIGSTFSHLRDLDLRSYKLPGEPVSISLDDRNIYPLYRAGDYFRLARIGIEKGILDHQHIFADNNSTSGSVRVYGTHRYVLFDHELFVLDYAAQLIDANMTVNSLKSTASNLEVNAPSKGVIHLKSSVVPFGFKVHDAGCIVLTSSGAIEVGSFVNEVSLSGTLEQSVFYWSENSPITFVPLLLTLVKKNGQVALSQDALQLAEAIATSAKVPPVPNMAAHLKLRSKYLEALVNLVLKTGGGKPLLDQSACVGIQNLWEQIETVRNLVEFVPQITDNSSEWLLYNTKDVLKLLKEVPIYNRDKALYAAQTACQPSLVQVGDYSYWLASKAMLQLLQNGTASIEHAEVYCRALVYAAANHTIAPGEAEKEENLLLKQLSGRGEGQRAREIATSLRLQLPLASLCTIQWLKDGDFEHVAAPIREFGYDFTSLVFDYLKSVGKSQFITTKFGAFPDYVYRYLDDEPQIQWAIDLRQGNSAKATQTLAKASALASNPKERIVLSSLLRLQALSEWNEELYHEASSQICQSLAEKQVANAVQGPLPNGFAAVVAETKDVLLKLCLLPPSPLNYVRCINMLPWGASDAHKQLLALQLVANTNWKALRAAGNQEAEAELLYVVLWNSLVDEKGIALLRPFLLGDIAGTKEMVDELVPQRYRAGMFADVKALNDKLQSLQNIRPWIEGAVNRPGGLY